jgi:hypothetical protein
VWSDPAVEWEAFDAVVIRSTWDYIVREEEFLGWIDRVEPLAPLVNAAPALRWNAHKTYLRELGERGVPVVDTLWVRGGERVTVPWEQAIVKPAVSASAIGLERVYAGDQIVTRGVDLLVQPLIESITSEGELSLLYAGNEFSHMVRKLPRAGDIRVQSEFGGEIVREEPSQQALDAADAVLAQVDHDLAYARVDLVRGANGTLQLMELELVEPQLFLAWDAEAPERFASAIARRVAVPRG